MSGIEAKNCPQCGAPVDSMATSCKFCGAEVPSQQQTQTQAPQYQAPQYMPPQVIIQNTAPQQQTYQSTKSKVTAAILAFFLGGIGIHKFYLGQGGMGVLYLIFCWTFIPATIAFIEAIILLTMSDESFNRKYGHL